MIGHPQGASGAAGVATTALAMTHGVLPPTINLDDPDPACEMDFIPNTSRTGRRGRRALQLPRLRIEEQRARAGTRAVISRRARSGESGVMCATTPMCWSLVPGRPAAPLRSRWRVPACACASSIAPSFPRDKLCGDTLNPGALSILDRLGVGDDVRACALADHRHDRDRTRRARCRRTIPTACAACRSRGGVSISCCSMRLPTRVRASIPASASASLCSRTAASSVCVWRGRRQTTCCARRVVIAADGRGSRLAARVKLSSYAQHAAALGVRRVLLERRRA